MSHYANDRQMFQYDEPQHLNGPWLETAKKGYNGAGHGVAAVGHGVAAAGRGVAAAGRGAGHAFLHPMQTGRNVKARSEQAYAAYIARRKMKDEIDICECSRRVQGHLAIQYPEFH